MIYYVFLFMSEEDMVLVVTHEGRNTAYSAMDVISGHWYPPGGTLD